jgi:ferric-dicitrate binding protein FerR (iron transport regulator)
MNKSALIYKVLSGTATQRERQQLQEWKNLGIENEMEFNDIKLLWDHSSGEVVSDTGQGWEKIKLLVQKRNIRRKRNRQLRIILIVVCIATILLMLMAGE